MCVSKHNSLGSWGAPFPPHSQLSDCRLRLSVSVAWECCRGRVTATIGKRGWAKIRGPELAEHSGGVVHVGGGDGCPLSEASKVRRRTMHSTVISDAKSLLPGFQGTLISTKMAWYMYADSRVFNAYILMVRRIVLKSTLCSAFPRQGRYGRAESWPR